jgi:carboxylate-amine ligase
VSPWADWNPAAAERPWSVGVEEEVMLLEPSAMRLANRVPEVRRRLPPDVAARTSAETHACVLELRTLPAPTPAAVTADLAAVRLRVDRALDRMALCAGAAGTHPAASWRDVEVSSDERYRRVRASMRVLAEREPTMALHVHVAVPGPGVAVSVLDGLRDDLPLLLALAANSPYWQGRDTGLASARTPIFSMFPRTGIPRRFERYAEYVAAVDGLVGSGAIPDPSFIWWDVRLQPRLGTIEVRVMDAQTRVADVAAITALVQCLVVLHAEGAPGEPLGPEALAENRFLAARDGMAAAFIAPGGREPAARRLEERLAACEPYAASLGCRDELEQVASLAARPGHARQRARGVEGALLRLASEFALPSVACEHEQQTRPQLEQPVGHPVARP